MFTPSRIMLRTMRTRKFSAVSGKVVVISGASSGIGEELAKLYASKGAKLVLSARRVEKLQEVAQKCNGAGGVEIVACDVSVDDDCKKLISKSVEHYGTIDYLILNAGIGQSFFLEKMAEDVNVRQFMDVNYYGCVYPTVAALPHLHTSAGRIVVVSSLGGIMPFPRQTLYNASKYALVGFFDTLRMELQSKRSQISITMVCPGFVKSEITAGGSIGRDGKPVGVSLGKGSPVRLITTEECARDIYGAALSRKRLVITPWWYIPLHWLRKVVPSLIDVLLVKIFAPPPKKK